jgi:calcium-dependent protein kinase
VVEESSFRLDQRKDQEAQKPQNSSSQANKIIGLIEKNILQRYMDQVQQYKLNIVINPRMLVSHRRNPIEVNYEVLEVIGKGGYGEVKKVRHKELDVVRALKVIKKSRYKSTAELKMIKNEISIMKVVDHPSIVKLYEFFEDDENFYIIQEFCSGG